MLLSDERRRRHRVALHWQVRLFRQPGAPPVETTTENLSSEGLYCIIREPFKPGERIQCEISIPVTLGLETPVVLGCHVTVKRVEPLRAIGAFGLACQIEDYAIAAGP